MVKKPATSPIGGGGDDDNDNGDERGGRMRVDPLIKALLGHLPPAHSVWPPQERQHWLEMLQHALGVIYKDAEQAKPQGAPPSGTSAQHPSGSLPTTR